MCAVRRYVRGWRGGEGGGIGPAHRDRMEAMLGRRTKRAMRKRVVLKAGGGAAVGEEEKKDEKDEDDCGGSLGGDLVSSISHCRAAMRAAAKQRKPIGWKKEYAG